MMISGMEKSAVAQGYSNKPVSKGYCRGEESNETESSNRGDDCSDRCVDSMHGVRHLSRRAGYGPCKGDQYLYGVYRPWLRKQVC